MELLFILVIVFGVGGCVCLGLLTLLCIPLHRYLTITRPQRFWEEHMRIKHPEIYGPRKYPRIPVKKIERHAKCIDPNTPELDGSEYYLKEWFSD